MNCKNIFKNTLPLMLAIALAGTFFSGCSTPRVSRSSPVVDLDEQDSMRGIGAPEIRQVGSELMAEILTLPEVADAEEPVRIVFSKVANHSSFPMDMNIFARKLRQELMKNGRGMVRIIANAEQNGNVNVTRDKMLKQRVERNRDKAIDQIAKTIAEMEIFKKSETRRKIAIIPAMNCNLVNMNANGFIAKLRSKISQYSKGKIGILLPGETAGADYLLTGQFVAESVKNEGIVNLADYISLMEERLRDKFGVTAVEGGVGGGDTTITNSNVQIQNSIVHTGGAAYVREKPRPLLDEIERSRDVRTLPDVPMFLNVILVDAKDRIPCYEESFDIYKKFDDNSANANMILAGEVSSVSKRDRGLEDTYFIFSFKLTDPESNELIWEGSVETRKRTRSGVVY